MKPVCQNREACLPRVQDEAVTQSVQVPGTGRASGVGVQEGTFVMPGRMPRAELKPQPSILKYFKSFSHWPMVQGKGVQSGQAAFSEDKVKSPGVGLFQKFGEDWEIHLTQHAMSSLLRSEMEGEVFDWNELKPEAQQNCLGKMRAFLKILGASDFLKIVEVVKGLGGFRTVGGVLSFLAELETFFTLVSTKYSAEESLNFLLQMMKRHQDVYGVVGSLGLIWSLWSKTGLQDFAALSELLETLIGLTHQSGLEPHCHRDLTDAWSILIGSGVQNPRLLLELTRRCHDAGQIRYIHIIADCLVLNLKKGKLSDSEMLILAEGFLRPIEMSASLGEEGVYDWLHIFKRLNLEPASCRPGLLGAHLAERWNSYVANFLSLDNKDDDYVKKFDEFVSTCGAMVGLLDALHHFARISGKERSLRKQFISGLSSEAAYALLSSNVTSSYASTFGMIWSHQQERYAYGDLSSWLRAADSKGVFWKQFLLNLAAYNPWGGRAKRTQLSRRDADFFLGQIVQWMGKSNRINLTEEASPLLKLTERILPHVGLQQRRAFAQNFMIWSRFAPRIDQRAAAAFFLKVFADRLGMEEDDEWQRRLASFPELPTPKFPGPSWKASGQIRALQRFYPDENWFAYNLELYRQRAWVEHPSYVQDQGLDPRRYQALHKWVDGVELLMVLELYDPKGPLLDLQDFTLRVHRGHGYNADLTFTGEQLAADTPDVVNINGGCYGFSTMLRGDFALSQASSIGDANVGKGEDTSRLVEDLMVGMVRGEKDWDFLSSYQEQGFVFPNDPAFQMRQYWQLFETDSIASTEEGLGGDEELQG